MSLLLPGVSGSRWEQGAGARWGALVCGCISIPDGTLPLGPEQPAAISMRVWLLNGQAFGFQ